jgi:penicillin amidase
VDLTVRSTRHGPIVTDLNSAYRTIAEHEAAALGRPAPEHQLSLQWTALTPGPTPSAIFAFNVARDWPSFRAAAASFQVPSQNLLYADVDGNIGYQAPGAVPIRASEEGTMPVPGWTSRYGWVGSIPYDELPSVLNPPRGYIVTANNAAVGPEFPQLITRDWDAGYRAKQIDVRLQRLLSAEKKVTAAEMRAIQADTYDANAATLAPLIIAIGNRADPASGMAKAARLLTGWDYGDDADSAAAAYFAVFWKNLLADAFGRKLPASAPPDGGDRWFRVVQTLVSEPGSEWWTDSTLGVAGRDDMIEHAGNAAWKEAVQRLGGDPSSWRWGSLHTLELTNASFGTSGIAPVEWLFNRGPYRVGGGSSIVNATGWDASAGYEVGHVPSMRMVIDLADFDRSTWVNLTGASGHAFDPHYADQTALWVRGQTRPWPFTPAASREAATQTLRLTP